MSQSVRLAIAASPQFFDRLTTAKLTWTVFLALVPAATWGIVSFGPQAGLVIAVSVLGALIFDTLIQRRLGLGVAADGHAATVGLLVAMTMPPQVPIYVPLLAVAFAVCVVKWPLGGRGGAWLHPAAAGWAFAQISWPHLMTSYSLPAASDAGSGTTSDALGAVTRWLSGNPPEGLGPADILTLTGFYRSEGDGMITGILNSAILNPVGAYLPAGYMDALLGTGPGAIGQVSAVLLLLGSIVLLSRRVVSWQTPFAYFVSFALVFWTFGGLPFGQGLGKGDILFYFLNGSLLLVLFFMATDWSTSPLTIRGRVWYGIGLGVVTAVLFLIGGNGQTALVALLCMQPVVGGIDNLSAVRRRSRGDIQE